MRNAVCCVNLRGLKTPKKPTKPRERAADRVVKSLAFPNVLLEEIQRVADERFKGDFTRAVFEGLAKAGSPAARKFLRTNTTAKFSTKK